MWSRSRVGLGLRLSPLSAASASGVVRRRRYYPQTGKLASRTGANVRINEAASSMVQQTPTELKEVIAAERTGLPVPGVADRGRRAAAAAARPGELARHDRPGRHRRRPAAVGCRGVAHARAARAGGARLDARRRRPVAQRVVRQRHPGGRAPAPDRQGPPRVRRHARHLPRDLGRTTQTASAIDAPSAIPLSPMQRKVLIAPVPPRPRVRLGDAGDQPPDRRGGVPDGRRGQGAPARAVRALRAERAAPEREAGPAGRDRARRRRARPARFLRPSLRRRRPQTRCDSHTLGVAVIAPLAAVPFHP